MNQLEWRDGLASIAREVMQATQVSVEIQPELEARLLNILDKVADYSSEISFDIVPVKDQKDAIGITVRLKQQPWNQQQPNFTVITRYIKRITESDLAKNDTALYIFRGDGYSNAGEFLDHSQIGEIIHIYLINGIIA